MKTPRIDIGSIRRQQIVESAVAIIAEKGLPELSLSQIEKRAGMSRGQLTYYFPAKEDILLAVFDRLLQLMYERIHEQHGVNGSGERHCTAGDGPCTASAWEWISHFLHALLLQPPSNPEFHSLQYTFLAQMSHREDFRKRLARLYEEWRTGMAQGITSDLAPTLSVSARTLASLVQGLLHGLSMQLAADPQAFDRDEMLKLCLDVLGNYFQSKHRLPAGPPSPAANGNGKIPKNAPAKQPRRTRSPRTKVSQ
jgi:AcrR family transcriptional regulator